MTPIHLDVDKTNQTCEHVEFVKLVVRVWGFPECPDQRVLGKTLKIEPYYRTDILIINFCVTATCTLGKQWVWQRKCAYVCLCVPMCTYVCLFVPINTYVCPCVPMCVYVCLCVHMCVYVCLCVHMCANVCLCVPMCAYVCLCVPMCAYVCVQMCVYVMEIIHVLEWFPELLESNNCS